MKYFALLAALLAISNVDAQRSRNNFTRHRAITPSDTVLVTDCQRIYIGGAGNIAIEDSQNPAVIIVYTVAAGTFLDFVPYRIRATSTTATAISCWY